MQDLTGTMQLVEISEITFLLGIEPSIMEI